MQLVLRTGQYDKQQWLPRVRMWLVFQLPFGLVMRVQMTKTRLSRRAWLPMIIFSACRARKADEVFFGLPDIATNAFSTLARIIGFLLLYSRHLSNFRIRLNWDLMKECYKAPSRPGFSMWQCFWGYKSHRLFCTQSSL